MKIAILTPSRQRADQYERFESSVFDLQSGDNEVKFFVYLDNDDPEFDSYSRNSRRDDRRRTSCGEPISVSMSWNVIAEKAKNWGADILIMGNDDLIYRTENWDRILCEKIKDIPVDGIWCAWMDDLINGEKHCAFPIIPIKVYDILGYFTPGCFNFGYNDTWLFDIFNRIERTFYIKEIVAEHMHVAINKQAADATWHRNRSGPRGNLYALDAKIWGQTTKRREDAANHLASFITK
jgi:hypothetical protein